MRRPIRSRPVLIIAFGTLILAALTRALAAPGEPPAESMKRIGSILVAYRDLDLRKDADVQALLGRLERAAAVACGGNPRFHTSYEVAPRLTVEVFEECRRNAVARAVTEIDAPALSRAWERNLL